MSVEIDAVRGKELLCFQRPGPKRGAERTVDRLDVARCQLCHTHHDADHECQSCGEATPENPEGNVAVRALVSSGQLVARVLCKDETHDTTVEMLAMPHAATCAPPPPEPTPPAGVLDLEAARRRKASTR